jgi:hypothetical protein
MYCLPQSISALLDVTIFSGKITPVLMHCVIKVFALAVLPEIGLMQRKSRTKFPSLSNYLLPSPSRATGSALVDCRNCTSSRMNCWKVFGDLGAEALAAFVDHLQIG